MNILILGSGGREHALSWRLSLDQTTTKIYVWPGNDGIIERKVELVSAPFNEAGFRAFLKNNKIDLVVPGSEKYLYEGVSDWCQEEAIACFGPSKSASRLESSKIYSKMLMQRAGVPTSPFRDITEAFNKDINLSASMLKEFKKPVIKISGPSLGKGVFVCDTFEEGYEILRQLKENPLLGMEDGLLVEEAVTGKEVSVFFACNGTNYSYLGSAQDHKRLFDGDKGQNTGGMGAVSPVSWVNDDFIRMVTDKFLVPTLKLMNETGNPFKGVLFLGIMTDGEKTNLLEYNVRFGDPETQVLMPMIDGDFAGFLKEFTQNQNVNISLKTGTAVHVVKAARGYPGIFGTSVEKGKEIILSTKIPANGKLFFAGIRKSKNTFITDGGRVLGITSWAPTKEEARYLAYTYSEAVYFEGQHYRSDIGKNA